MSATKEFVNRRELVELDDDGNEVQPNSWKVVSQGEGGFDEVHRADYTGAKSAATVHERATGNECELIPEYE